MRARRGGNRYPLTQLGNVPAIAKFQFVALFAYAVGGGAFDAPAAQCFDFALVFGEYILLSAGLSRAPAPTRKINLIDKLQFDIPFWA